MTSNDLKMTSNDFKMTSNEQVKIKINILKGGIPDDNPTQERDLVAQAFSSN